MEPKASKDITFGYNLKCYWEVMKAYKLLIGITIILIILGTAIDLFGSYLFKIVVDKGNAFASGTLTKELFIDALLMAALLYGITEVSSWFFSFFRMKTINKLETGAMYDLKKKYFDHIMDLSHNFYTTHKTGSLISRMSRGGSALERMTDVFAFNGVPIIFQFAMAIGSMLVFDWLSALIATLAAITFIVFSIIFQRIQEPSSLEANKREDFEKGNIADIFTNIDSIKYFGKESFIKKRYHNIANKTREAFLKNWNYYNFTSAGQTAILGTGLFFIIYVSVLKVLNGDMSIGTLVFINAVYLQLLGPLYGLVHGIRGFYRSMADFQDLFA
jgi:ABC-type transport system involved in Fe-S cluster assembly fused permease/ATPase subunit